VRVSGVKVVWRESEREEIRWRISRDEDGGWCAYRNGIHRDFIIILPVVHPEFMIPAPDRASRGRDDTTCANAGAGLRSAVPIEMPWDRRE
jgi:hypothetical protein